GRAVELRISSARVRKYEDACFGLVNQPVILVPDADEKALSLVAELVAGPCKLEASPGTVIQAEDWSYRVAPVAGRMELAITNPLRRSRDLVLEVEHVTEPKGLEVRLPGARNWRRAANVEGWEVATRSGKLVVYVPDLKGKKTLGLRIRR
ncbi:MAG: hypothetical protein KAX80_13635, partial [Planctomycetes bacterium]|nr:hypothetical protein [Planctomycetota bacterium]